MGDSTFSVLVHCNEVLIDVVDDEWQLDKLPNEEILPPGITHGNEEEEQASILGEADKWVDFGFNQSNQLFT